MAARVMLDHKAVGKLWEAAKKAAAMAAEEIHRDLVSSGTMPFASGTMQNTGTFVDGREAGGTFAVSVATDSPQARRLYFHPEYRFYQGHNPSAGGQWLEPYLSGGKKDLAEKAFAGIFRKEAGL